MKRKDIALLTRAAKRGDTQAQLALAARLATGDGLPQDEAEAARWYTAAANDGSGDAAYNLATMYERGEGVRKSKSKALALYRKAEKLGSGDASIILGELSLSAGADIQSNILVALEHFALAALHHDMRGILLIALTLQEHPSVPQTQLIQSMLQACNRAGLREAKKALQDLKKS